jgi:hypothetical protein
MTPRSEPTTTTMELRKQPGEIHMRHPTHTVRVGIHPVFVLAVVVALSPVRV